MKRHERILAMIGIAWLAYGAVWIRSGRLPQRDVALDGGAACPAAPVTILDPLTAPPRGAVVIFHGLSANRIVMLTNGQQFATAGFRVFIPDMPGHGADTAPFAFTAYESCASGLLATLQRTGEITPSHTVLLGHSLGAALVVRLADAFPASATIAVATAPLIPPHRVPPNLLLVAPQLDMPPVLTTELHLAAAAGVPRASPEDFRQLRAFRLLVVPHRSHTSALFDPAAAGTMLRWALDASGAFDAPAPDPDFRAFYGGWFGLLGIVLLFPAFATGAARVFKTSAPPAGPRAPQPSISFLSWIASLVPAAVISARWQPLAPLRLYGADFLAAVLLIAGLVLVIGYNLIGARMPHRGATPRAAASVLSPAICGAMVGILVILAAGAWLNLQITELWPIPARWMRFPVLLLALFPMSLAEERALGDPRPLSRFARAGRLALFAVLRSLVWLACLLAWLSGVSGALLPTILGVFLAALSLAQRLGADALRRRTGSALAASCFNAILGAWFLAAVLPLA